MNHPRDIGGELESLNEIESPIQAAPVPPLSLWFITYKEHIKNYRKDANSVDLTTLNIYVN